MALFLQGLIRPHPVERLSTRMRRLLPITAVLVFNLMFAGRAAAHSPIFNDAGSPTLESAFEIHDLSNSKAIMGAIRRPGAIDYYRIEAPDGFPLDLGLLVPIACEGFFPSFAIIGPNLENNPSSVPLELPPGAAVYEASLPAEQWGTFFEPFDPSFYAQGPTFKRQTVQATYYLAVYDPQGKTGSYLLATGGEERWQPDEDWRARKSEYDQCEFGESDPFLRRWRSFALGLLGIAGLGAGAAIYRRRVRRGRVDPSQPTDPSGAPEHPSKPDAKSP